MYAACVDEDSAAVRGVLRIELVLRRFVDMNPSREMRCFVRNNTLIGEMHGQLAMALPLTITISAGISQRDLNFYEHLQITSTREKIRQSVREFWLQEVKGNYRGGNDCGLRCQNISVTDYPTDVFDIYLNSNFTSASVIDFHPYRSSTDPLLFTYNDLLQIYLACSGSDPPLPELRIVDSRSHPAANRNAPAYQANMVPLEMLQFSEGRNMDDFKNAWAEAVAAGMQNDSESEKDD